MAHRSPSNRVTMRDVAQAAQTSIASVSYFLNGRTDKLSLSTQQKIRTVIEEMGYIPNAQAQNLHGYPTHVIAVLILNNNNLWASQFMEGVESVAVPHKYQTVICNTNFNTETELNYIEKMLALGVDGFIIQPTSNYKDVYNRITKAGRPVIFFDCSLYSFEATWIKSSLYDSIYASLTHCIESGWEEFISIGGDVNKTRTRQERFAGFVDVLAAKHLPYRHWEICEPEPSLEMLTNKIQLEIHPSKRTLLFVHNQWALPNIVKAVQPSRQLIADKLGILGINCSEWSEISSPSISTIIEPVHQEGARACELLIEKLDGMKQGLTVPARQEILPCSTRWLESTGTIQIT